MTERIRIVRGMRFLGAGFLVLLAVEILLQTYAEGLLFRGTQSLGNQAALPTESLLRAEQWIQKAASLAPSNADALFAMGELHLLKARAEEHEAARETLSREALQHYRQALAANPFFAKAYFRMGFLFLFQGQEEKAEAAFERTLQAAPFHVDMNRQIADYLLEKWLEAPQGPVPAEVLALFAKANQADPQSIRESLARLAPFVSTICDLEPIVPDTFEGHSAFADFLLDQRYYADAFEHCRAADAKKGEQGALLGKAYLQVAREKMESRRWDEALSYLEAAHLIQGKRFSSDFDLGSAYVKTGRLEEGMNHLLGMLHRGHSNFGTFQWIFGLLKESGRLEEGMQLWERFLEERPSRFARYFLGLTQFALGEWSKAEENIKVILKAREEGEAYFHLYLIAKGQGSRAHAKQYLQEAVRCQPENLTYLKALEEWN